MTWTKLSDDFADECWTLSSEAFRLLVEMLNWSNRKLLDCMIPRDDIRRFAKHPEALPELLADGWVIDRGKNVEVIFHATFQRDREQAIAIQQRNQENGKKGGRPRNPTFGANPHGNPNGNRYGNPEGRVKDGPGIGQVQASEIEVSDGTKPDHPDVQALHAKVAEWGKSKPFRDPAPGSAPVPVVDHYNSPAPNVAGGTPGTTSAPAPDTSGITWPTVMIPQPVDNSTCRVCGVHLVNGESIRRKVCAIQDQQHRLAWKESA